MKDKPRVFISYSHDSEEHKKWVATLATQLAESNLDVTLDQWNLHYGGDIARFMEIGIREADRVVMICSDRYVEKANQRIKGVGYEGMIVTAELFQDLDTNKFIPVIAGQSGDPKLPTFLGTRLYLDFGDEKQRNTKLAELVNDIVGLYRLESGTPDIRTSTSARLGAGGKQAIRNISALIFAAGKSTRMKAGRSKMIEPAIHDGVIKPMLAHTVDLYHGLGLKVIVLVGFDGDNVMSMLEQACPDTSVVFLRVAANDGSGLKDNTGGTLSKYAFEIDRLLSECEHVLLSVGDQPHMREQTIREFVGYYTEEGLDACILTAYARGTELEKCSSTRVNIVGGELEFHTPPRGVPFNYQSYSSLLDVGVILIKRSLLTTAAQRLHPTDVFGLIVRHTSNPGTFEEFKNPEQFLNINEPISPAAEDIILKWIEWNVDHDRTSGLFNPFSFKAQYEPDFEMDITLQCSTTPACARDCTYREQHGERTLDEETGVYVLEKAYATGFAGVLFSGGGECLEPGAYKVFLEVLRAAKAIGLRTHLATNGLYINDKNVDELVSKLDSIRFSVACKAQLEVAMDGVVRTDLFPPHVQFSHIGLLGESISKVRRVVDAVGSSTQLWANVLMSSEMSMDELRGTILMLSHLGIHGIRLKAKHIYTKGAFYLNPKLFIGHMREIEVLRELMGKRLPEITVSKIGRLLREQPAKLEHITPTHCWYGDFNPLVVGCDGRNYACCEMKYQKPFRCGEVDRRIDNFHEMLRSRSPQRIIGSKCFIGCKGFLMNRDLQYLLDEYKRSGKGFLADPENKQIHDRVLKGIARTSPYN